MGDPAADRAAKEFAVAADKGGIYVYRNENFGAAIKMEVAVDGEVLGSTGAKTYLFKEVEPGAHTVTSKAENTSSIEVDVAPGSLAYIWQEVKLGVLVARSKLQQVSEEQGRKGVLESKLAVK
jgi:hypothetical protein